MHIDERLAALRTVMQREGVDGYIIPSSDPHQSEYPPDHWKARGWITGFDGSAGSAVVTRDWAGLWTDSRYYLHAEKALAGTSYTLFKHGMADVADYPEHLAASLPAGSVVGFCGSVFSESRHRRLVAALRPGGLTTKRTGDLIGELWQDRPTLPQAQVFEHNLQFAGRSRGEKLAMLRKALEDQECGWTVIAAVDDIAWLFNLRGADVPFNPVFLSYAAVSRDRALLFVDPRKVPGDLIGRLEDDGVTIMGYGEIADTVASIPPDQGILLDPDRLSVELFAAAVGRRVEGTNPTTLFKARKSKEELRNLRRCMVRDGAAMVEFLAWISAAVKGPAPPTEYQAQIRLRDLRATKDLFVSESFNTISAYNANAPIVHYAADEDDCATLSPEGLYLVDSGGQYHDGTTDITRTIALGPPTDRQKRDYTLVLKAHIALATAAFPAGTTGHELDSIARNPLWEHGANYGHGTGHGVGYFLNVHEGPQRISPTPNTVALEEGMLISNEPGLYRTGQYGIRIENLIVVTLAEKRDFGEFHRFETVTLCPIDTSVVDAELLTERELRWLNEYNTRVRGALESEVDGQARDWLLGATEPMEREKGRG